MRRVGLPQAQRSTRWAFMESFEIPDYDHPERNYLTRLRVVQTPWFAVYLHRMDGPDPRPTLHDHPWSFVSIILSLRLRRRGYHEVTCYGCPERRVRWLNVKRAENTHYIRRLADLGKPTYTLMLVGRRRREWGYVDPDGTWTRFDRHPHAAEFDAALARRQTVAGGHVQGVPGRRR